MLGAVTVQMTHTSLLLSIGECGTSITMHCRLSCARLGSSSSEHTHLATFAVVPHWLQSLQLLLPTGESGTSKTTFIYNLASGFKVVHPGMAHVDAATTMRQFKADPSSLRTVLEPLDMPECNTRLQISIQVRSGHCSVP